MKRYLTVILLLLSLLGTLCLAQTNQATSKEDFKPSTLNRPGQEYLQVNSQGYTRFCTEAPQAQSVNVSLGGREGITLTNTENGAWMGITPQLSPIKVDGGMVQGTTEDGLAVFKGIPFAAPPIGDLRWRAPQPVSKWDTVLQADKFAPGPIQAWDSPSGKSEDCLYLNIWTPAKSANDRMPVLVWIYGGGFNGGVTSVPIYNGEHLAKKGVVLVSIAYRVGRLGFLAHPELSTENENHVSGNYGLLDMITGLKWIQKNIAAFGGEPEKVTIFGESAGGIAVSMLCASPLAKGLFHGAISQSGGSFGPPRPTTYPGENMKRLDVAEQQGLDFAKSTGVSSIAELRKIPADSLARNSFGRGMAWPIIDGYVILDDQYKLYEKGQFNDTPILVGYNSDEGASFTRTRDPQEYIKGVKERFGMFADKLLKAYPVSQDTIPKTARDLARDAAFGWHTWIWARLQAKMGKYKAYYYYFDQHPDYPEDSPQAGYGSPHGQDIAYVFKTLDTTNSHTIQNDLEISESMATYWTNFAKYGDPNGEGVPEWQAFSDEKPTVMYFNKTPHMGPVPSAESLEVLDNYFTWRRTPEGDEGAK
jgi:para-nitrobenzyl esterase